MNKGNLSPPLPPLSISRLYIKRYLNHSSSSLFVVFLPQCTSKSACDRKQQTSNVDFYYSFSYCMCMVADAATTREAITVVVNYIAGAAALHPLQCSSRAQMCTLFISSSSCDDDKIHCIYLHLLLDKMKCIGETGAVLHSALG